MTSVNDDYLPGHAFEIPGQGVGVQQARYLFFRAVHRVHPSVTTELMGEPLDMFRPLVPLLEPDLWSTEMPPPQQIEGWYLTPARGVLMPFWEVFKSITDHDPAEFHQFRDRLLQWADRWRLWSADPDDDWCLAYAADAIARAVGDDAYRTDPFRYIRFIVQMAFPDEEVQFAFTEPEGWQPTFEGWAEAERRLDDAYRRAKQTYKERIERACREEGLSPVRSSRRRKGSPFEWLALYQTRGERWAWIAEEETKRLASLGDKDGVTDKAVAKAASDKADLIGLKLADSSRGRPRKQANSEARNRT